MSALPPKADMASGQLNVRFVPKADVRIHAVGYESGVIESLLAKHQKLYPASTLRHFLPE
jgi:hypothetical protein